MVSRLAPGRQDREPDPITITRGASSAAARAVQRRCQAGELARLAPGIYVPDRDSRAQAARVREHWVRIVGELVPGSVVSYRSAYAGAPAEGVLILSNPTRFNRTIRLPGLRVALVRGPGPLPGDTPLGDGALHLASMERLLLENLKRPRGPDGRSRGEAAVHERLVQISRDGGPAALERLRVRVGKLAAPLQMPRERQRLQQLIDVLRQAALGAATQADGPDADCVVALQALAGQLRARRWLRVPAPASDRLAPDRFHRAFVEAWFDCFDGGDRASIEQARPAVLGGQEGSSGSPWMRQLMSVFKLAVVPPLCDSVPPFGSYFPQGLKARHALMMHRVQPGMDCRLRDWGEAAVPAAATVEPGRIARTLAEGSTLALSVPEGLARAIFYSILVWRVQPFDHGSEALALLLMNAELSSAGQARILIPARLRARFEDGRERWSASGDAGRIIRLLAALQRWSASLDFADLDVALDRLVRMRAFVRPAAQPATPPP